MPSKSLWNVLGGVLRPATSRRRPGQRRLPRRLEVERLDARVCPAATGLSLTAAGKAAGLSLSSYVDGFPSGPDGEGPIGISYLSGGKFAVSDGAGNVRIVTSDTDGQHAASFPAAGGDGTAGQTNGLAQVGGALYLAHGDAGNVVQLKADGTIDHTIVSIPDPVGIVANPGNGHLFVSSQGAGNTSTIYDVDPVAKTDTVFANVTSSVDGLALDSTAGILYGATPAGVLGWNVSTKASAFDSGAIAGTPKGVALGTGSFAGNLLVNTDGGTLIEVNLSTKAQTPLASGGSHGSLLAVDPTNNSLLVTQTDSILRLSPPAVVNPGPAATLTVAGFPTPATAGTSDTLTVTAKDAQGHVATGYTGTVHFTSSDSHAGLPADYTFVAADHGTHTFPVTLNTTGSQSLTVTDKATATITGSETAITVNPAADVVTGLTITGLPTSVTVGHADSITVTAVDAQGHPVAGYAGTIHFTSSDAQAGLPADYTFVAADHGAHTFPVTLKTQGAQTITVADKAQMSLSKQADVTVTPPVVANPVPKVTTLGQTSVMEGSGALTLTIHGTGFVHSSVVHLNGAPLATTFVSATDVQVVVPASALAHPTSLSFTVVNPTPGGGTSNAGSFAVTEKPLVPGATLPTIATKVNQALSKVVVASFTDPDGAANAKTYLATIDWKDGKISTGTVTVSPKGVLKVTGGHTYHKKGTYRIKVTVHHNQIAPDLVITTKIVVS
jgi:hypothetical protein